MWRLRLHSRRSSISGKASRAALEFLTGYVLELSLSVDNLFVFLLIFNYFAVPEEHQHRALFWGVIGRTDSARDFHWCRRWADPSLPLGPVRFRSASSAEWNPIRRVMATGRSILPRIP